MVMAQLPILQQGYNGSAISLVKIGTVIPTGSATRFTWLTALQQGEGDALPVITIGDYRI